MYIQEAVKEALKTKGCIARTSLRSGMLQSNTQIIPTNTYDCCIILGKGKENRQSRYWNPTADDLIAADWEVFKE